MFKDKISVNDSSVLQFGNSMKIPIFGSGTISYMRVWVGYND